MSESNPVTERYHEAIFHGSPSDLLSEDNAKWLASRDESLDAVIRVQRIRHENPELALSVSTTVQDPKYRPIMLAVAQGGGSTVYDEMESYTTVTRRTVKARVREIAEKNVLCVDVDAKPAVIAFPDEIVDVLVRDSLSLFFSTNELMK